LPTSPGGDMRLPIVVDELGTAGWTRTTDLLIHSQAL
jgi:hypothetical protein